MFNLSISDLLQLLIPKLQLGLPYIEDDSSTIELLQFLVNQLTDRRLNRLERRIEDLRLKERK